MSALLAVSFASFLNHYHSVPCKVELDELCRGILCKIDLHALEPIVCMLLGIRFSPRLQREKIWVQEHGDLFCTKFHGRAHLVRLYMECYGNNKTRKLTNNYDTFGCICS